MIEPLSFTIGVLTTGFVIALFTSDEKEVETDEERKEDLEVKNYTGKIVTLSCQSCRKLKRHKELKPYVFECVKCKRKVDLR